MPPNDFRKRLCAAGRRELPQQLSVIWNSFAHGSSPVLSDAVAGFITKIASGKPPAGLVYYSVALAPESGTNRLACYTMVGDNKYGHDSTVAAFPSQLLNREPLNREP
jgi:hypothetical protein